ncbi:MAG: hypothetical protein P1V20_22795 [Verrucomicrobiales bacterium]|nr:hypothetical protein [Verrucomicrobiales bacterium]
MYDRFLNKFTLTDNSETKHAVLETELEKLNIPENKLEQFRSFLVEFSGKTFDNGLYRIYKNCDLFRATTRLFGIFPGVNGKAIVFASSWIGEQFAIRINDGSVVMLRPETGEAFDVADSIIEFHNRCLVDKTDSALESELFISWLKSNGSTPIPYESCVGLVIPLSLGGVSNDLTNMEICDSDVYIETCSQINGVT